MNQREAFRETVELAQMIGMPEAPGTPLGLAHLRDMERRIDAGDFSPSKLGRWLGWAQCALVAANVGVTLEDVKQINLRYAVDTSSNSGHEPVTEGNMP